MTRKPEVVFNILGEGGGLYISRIIHNGQQEEFITNHQEMDFSDEGLDVNKQLGYSSFEEAFTYINKYPWHSLYLGNAHKDYRVFVLDQLIKKLTTEFIEPEYINNSIRQHEHILSASIYKNQSGQWCYSLTDPSAARKWDKSNISFDNYRDYIQAKQNRFELTLIDLLYISNFKGGNATINEPEYEINYKLGAYISKFWEIEKEFYNKSLWELDSKELERLTDIVIEACNLTKTSKTKIDGLSVSYLSGLLCAHFPNLIPIIDRRVLKNLHLATDQDFNSLGQVKNILRFYPQLIEKIAIMCKDMRLSVRKIDRKLFVTKI